MASAREGRSGCWRRQLSTEASHEGSAIIAKRSVFVSFAIWQVYVFYTLLQTCVTCVSYEPSESSNSSDGSNQLQGQNPCNRLLSGIAGTMN